MTTNEPEAPVTSDIRTQFHSELDTIKVRGRQRPAKIFQVLTGDAPVPQSALDAYAAGREALAAGEWGRAIAAFEAALAAAPNDGPSAVMLAMRPSAL